MTAPGLPAFGVDTITVERAPLLPGPYGADRYDWDAAVSHDVAGCSVQPGTGTTDVELRAGVRADWAIYAPVDADILGTDRVRVPGDDRAYQVIGEPGRWRTGLPNDHTLIAVEGWKG